MAISTAMIREDFFLCSRTVLMPASDHLVSLIDTRFISREKQWKDVST
jgi:hypothetical protein